MPEIPSPPSSTNRPTPRRVWPAGAIAVVLGSLVLWPVIFSGAFKGRAGSDQVLFHEPTIRAFARQWPDLDFRDYWSATTPGYHVALAAVVKAAPGIHRVWLQWAGSLFALATLGVVAVIACRELGCARRAWVRSVVLVLPLLASVYVVHAGAWLLPDNAGWLMVSLALGLALWRVRGDASRRGQAQEPTTPRQAAWLLDCALVVVALVFVRQSHAWAAGVLMAAAFVGRWREHESAAILLRDFPTRVLRALLVAVACIPAALLLWRFTELWGGLTPPRFAGQHASGMNPATPAVALALLGVYSLFFAGFWMAGLSRLWGSGRGRALLLVAGVVGLGLAAVPETTYFIESRMGGIWQLVGALERRGLVIAAHSSPVFLVFTPLGAIALCAWVASMRGPRAPVLFAAVTGFIAAQTANPNAWQRYLEPGLLMLIALMSAAVWPSASEVVRHRRLVRPARRRGRTRIDARKATGLLRWVGPLALALLLGAITLAQTAGGIDIDVNNPPPIPPYVYTGPLE